ncbi:MULTISPECIES: hypothetical protein [Streptococcus]|nr:hypothetical protein [Streptococcus suis]
MAIGNGGAIAQKGFNYQNCVVSLVAIRNYKKPNLKHIDSKVSQVVIESPLLKSECYDRLSKEVI